MTMIASYADELSAIHNGEAWHGPALKEILSGLTWEQAAARPLAGAHSIWELVLHITAWERVFISRLEGRRTELPEEGDFPAVDASTPEAWKQAQDRLDQTHERLIALVSGLSEADLDRQVTGKDYPIDYLLRGIARHHVYHAGQIALLRKSFVA
jgi:uncharacterized damage-inducible protein DinB